MANLPIYILLQAKDLASKTIRSVDKEVGRLGKSATLTRKAAVGMAVGVGAAAGATALFVGRNVTAGIDSLAQLESATSAVSGAIKTMGLTGQVTADQVAGWANQIEEASGAAFDDKAITAATASLIRYGSVTTPNLRRAMVVMTDLAAKTGDEASAATLLGKALADPTKAAGKLSRAGVVLTKAQQDQIKALDKAGKKTQAQALLLSILEQRTKGAAAASQGPYTRAMKMLGDAVEDAQRALAVGFLPVIEEVATWLRGELVKPQNIAAIKEFGQGLANGLREGVKWARSLPWAQIADGLRTAAGFAKALIGAFTSLPPQVQATIISLAALNKLSGGVVVKLGVDFAENAISKLGGSLLQRGGTPATPMYTKEVGLGGGGGGGGTGVSGLIGKLVAAGLITAVAAEVEAQTIAPYVDRNNGLERRGLNQPQRRQAIWNSMDRAGRDAATKHGYGNPARTQTATSTGREVSTEIRNGFVVGSREIRNGFVVGSHAWSSGMRDSVKAIRGLLGKTWSGSVKEILAGIKGRGTARGGKPQQSDVMATFGRNAVRKADEIARSTASSSQKIEALRRIQADAKAAGDTKTAAKIAAAIKAEENRLAATTSRAAAASDRAAAAIRAKKMIAQLNLTIPVSVRTTNTVSLRNVLSQSNTYVRYVTRTGRGSIPVAL